MLLYAATIFLSAFLLFQVQPIIAKIILPWFGGSAAVWTTCMLFFQTALLGGYLYSHTITHRMRSRAQTTLHMILLVASLLVLPILPPNAWKPSGEANPTFGILLLLAGTVGVPYLLLSTTGPLIQAWYARAFPGASPYRLFALSNIGSMLALLGYPVLVEPVLPTREQAIVWSVAYAVFAALCVTCAWKSRDLVSSAPAASDTSAVGPPLSMRLLWIGLAACASVLLLAITTHLTHDVAPIPFLWVIPLSIYMLSFILTFDGTGWYRRGLFLPLLAVSLAAITFTLTADKSYTIPVDIALYAVGLFVCCMACHGELSLLKPHPRYLTGFYLMISIGGAVGGLLTGVIAPYVFPFYCELQIGMLACGGLVLAANWGAVRLPLRLVSVAACLVMAGALTWQIVQSNKGYRFIGRNFYGVLQTHDYGTPQEPDYSRIMTHGLINHGEQYLLPGRRRETTSYFGPGSGVARAVLGNRRDRPQKVGITGLGAGVMITYARPGDHYRIYEINPMVIDVAKRDFSFIQDCPAKLDLILGDARLSLEREPPQNYDILHMDAFSSDSVPVHLLTREAFQLYFRHLKPDGILVMHISNRYLNMEPVVARAAEALGKVTALVNYEGDDERDFYPTTMVLVASDRSILQRAGVADAPARTKATVRLWTDDYSNLFRILK
ncbi:MAG: fused MFS/spermidine synthase [Acidobacteria bacterium]|nr:fused MFS/spermidine synthase [Acidobacteriota bacterium]